MPFFSFWIQGLRRTPTMAEIDEADDKANQRSRSPTSSTRRAREPCADALAGTAQALNDWPKALEASQRRWLSKIASACTTPRCLFDVAWMSYSWATLSRPIAIQLRWPLASFLARLRTGAHLFAWRAVTLNTLGRWDEAVGMFCGR